MTVTPHSIVVICATSDRAQLLAVGNAMGAAGGMDVALSANGQTPASHYGARSWATPVFVGIMTGAIAPTIPGVTAEQIQAALAGAIVDVVENAATQTGFSARAHFLTVCQALGLQRIEAAI
jgi:uncharacterized membrane protein YjjB (DUF3815 family)